MKKHNFNNVHDLKEVLKVLINIYGCQINKDNDLYHEYKFKLSDPDKSINNILHSKDLLNVALKETHIQKMINNTENLISLYEDYIDKFFETVKKY
jgi:hypothetical protein|tara:strand:+ start:1376 stop:1663 length:288 start_codon:yes stop_codon:yes gene_type:complete